LNWRYLIVPENIEKQTEEAIKRGLKTMAERRKGFSRAIRER